jgi:hypothetical protein
MNLKNKIQKNIMLALGLIIICISCQKITKPALGDYPKDTSPPGGPLKFYVAFDGSSSSPLMNAVDSIRANFAASNTGTEADGISGKSYQGSAGAFVKYGAPNDFTQSSNFTISFWVKKMPQPAGSGTQFVFSLNRKDFSWTNTKLFLEFEDAGNPSTTALAAAKFYIMDQWVEYTKHTSSEDRMPNVLNGDWHHLAFTYDGTNSQLLAYIDGALFHTDIVGAPLGPVDFGEFDDFTIGGPDQNTYDKNTWMGFWDGQIDQFRLYGTVLSAADIQALYSSKQ